ncbi:MAG: NUDIX domain-containing protein [Oscillospiraceae bacterium]|nr:NUDIX domain-containing protein [Oscillospiraceae bacterium]
MYKGRAQFIIVREGKILMARHCVDGEEYYCLPGGGIEPGETPEETALRELKEECRVDGKIVKKLGEFADVTDNGRIYYNYQIDIGDSEPALGVDPDVEGEPKLVGLCWLEFDKMSEKNRAFLWSAGIIAIKDFFDELQRYSDDDVSYPKKVKMT